MTEIDTPRGIRVLQRVIFPLQGNLDVVSLYVETKLERARSSRRSTTEGTLR